MLAKLFTRNEIERLELFLKMYFLTKDQILRSEAKVAPNRAKLQLT